MTTASESSLAARVASLVLLGFDDYTTQHRELNKRAPARFERRDWAGMQADTVERLRIYSTAVSEVVVTIRDFLGEQSEDVELWSAVKDHYSDLLVDRQDWELAETFHNSITRRVFETVGVNPRVEYVATDFSRPPNPAIEPVYRSYTQAQTTEQLVRRILNDSGHGDLFVDIDADAKTIVERVENRLVGSDIVAAEFVRSVFYRGQAAYLIGLLHTKTEHVPLVIALRNGADGVRVDAVLLTENEVSILFSFTRSYFHVDVVRPYDLVRFLKRLMPRKRVAEIYISLGQNKHGKTELYRDLLRHLDSAEEQFEHTEGTKGMVMIVFTMPGYDDVFKVIRDRFPPPKTTTRQAIMKKYRLVFRHDRAGRLMDVQDFQHLKFKRSRFSEPLLEELVTEASKTVWIEGDSVVVNHVYVERRIVPLDVYVRDAPLDLAAQAVVDYGQAIKDLASTNIFPGDLLLKNFGVTRHGRVVFYDYDELAPLVDVRFRKIPAPRDDLDALSDAPWYGVGPNDVFPEEHEAFLGLKDPLRALFKQVHGDLFEVEPWRSIQDRINAGELIEVFPYTEAARLPGTEGFRGW